VKRAARTAIALGAMAIGTTTGCADDGARAGVVAARHSVVAVVAQRCARPNPARGLGVMVGDGLVLTAGHTVEGDLRRLTVDDRPAEVVVVDRNLDLAVLRFPERPTPHGSERVTLSALRPANLVLLGEDGPHEVVVDSRETLVIEHATDRATYRRDVIVFTPGVEEGASGSPLVDDQGRLAGMVILNDDETAQGVAVTAGEIAGLLDRSAGATERPAASESC